MRGPHSPDHPGHCAAGRRWDTDYPPHPPRSSLTPPLQKEEKKEKLISQTKQKNKKKNNQSQTSQLKNRQTGKSWAILPTPVFFLTFLQAFQHFTKVTEPSAQPSANLIEIRQVHNTERERDVCRKQRYRGEERKRKKKTDRNKENRVWGKEQKPQYRGFICLRKYTFSSLKALTRDCLFIPARKDTRRKTWKPNDLFNQTQPKRAST